MQVTQPGGPAHEVVGQDCAGEPGGVGEELARRAVLETGSFLQVPDGEFDGGVGPVEPVRLDRVQLEGGDEGVVTPVRPELSLHRVGEPGAANDEADPTLGPLGLAAHPGHVRRLGHVGRPAVGIGDGLPGRLVDRLDAGSHLGVDGAR